MNPNKFQAIQNENQGEEELEEDIDYDAIYGGLEIDINPKEAPKTPEMENSYAKIFADVAKQGAKETLIGALGTYGDLAELAGANTLSNDRSSREFQAQERMGQPGYVPDYNDIETATGNSIEPQAFNLPTSNQLREGIEAIGGPGEAETPQGKYAARAGKLYGSGLAFGQVNPAPAIAGGVAGQAAEDLGADPLLQTAVEIVTMLATGRSNKPSKISSNKSAIQSKINELRKLGYPDEDITLALNSAYKNGQAVKIASKGAKTEQAFEDFAEHSDDIVNGILQAEIPGIEHGTKYVHELASDAYGKVAQDAANLVIKDSTPFIDSATSVVKQLRKNLGKNSEAETFINRLAEAVVDSTKNPTAESFMNFYKELNSMGKWMGRSQKDRLISEVKNGIKETFRKQGKEGQKLADKFEKANEGIRKAYLAEDAHEILQKVTGKEGIDYKKLDKVWDKAENIDLFQEVLGKTQTNNLRRISQIGKEVKDFDKAWKAVNTSATGIAQNLGIGYYLLQGDFVGLAKVLSTKVGKNTIGKIAEKSLTDPAYQNLVIRGLHAVKTASPKSLRSVNEGFKKYFEEQGIDIEL
jgi:hypothetical protein